MLLYVICIQHRYHPRQARLSNSVMRVENEQISCGKSCGNHFLSFAPNGIFLFRFNSCSLKAFRSAWVTQTVQPRISQNKHSWTSSLACQSTLYVFCCCQANSVPVGSRNHIITETSSSSTPSEKHFILVVTYPGGKVELCHSLQRAHVTEIIYFHKLYLKSSWNQNIIFLGF